MTTKEDRQEAAAILAGKLEPGDTVYTILRHVSASGMTRWISLIVVKDGDPWDISYLAARVLGRRISSRGSRTHEGIKIEGTGMDMGFSLVYDLSRALFQDGYDCTQYTYSGADLAEHDRTRRCHSSDHVNPPYPRVQMRHMDSGYALSHRWL